MDSSKSKLKVIDLPIYPCCCKDKKELLTRKEPPNAIEPYITDIRKEIQTFINPYLGDSFETFKETFAIAKEHTYDMIQHVRDEQNQVARATFITSATFLGYLFARRGFFRRTMFAIIAAGTSAAICEPKMTKDCAEVSFELAKRKLSEISKHYGPDIVYDYFQNIKWPMFNKSDENGNKK